MFVLVSLWPTKVVDLKWMWKIIVSCGWICLSIKVIGWFCYIPLKFWFSLFAECIDMEGISNGENEWNGLPHETPACGINPEFLAQHSTDPLLGGYTTSSAGASNTQNHLIQLEQNEVHCMQHNMPSEQDDIVRWSSTSMERERVARRWCSCCRVSGLIKRVCQAVTILVSMNCK